MKNRPSFVSEQLWRKYKLGWDRVKTIKRQILRFPGNPKLVSEYSAYGRAIKQRDWPRVLDHARVLTEMALTRRDLRLIQEMMKALERLDRYQESARLRLAERELLPNRRRDEWGGEDISGKTLLINFREPNKERMALGYRSASLVAKAADRARHVTVNVEPRLVPTYRRSFPDLEIVESLDQVEDGTIDVTASMANLFATFVPTENTPDPEFSPLLADQTEAAMLRDKYRSGHDKPLIGICWYSGHHGKLLPDIADWRRFIEHVDARFVSLQYGDVTQDLEILGSDRVIFDPAIDQLVDMDAFAAQVTALDGVMTITATLAHVGGALGTSTVVLRDDWFRREWPVMSDRVPWYPSLRVAGKDGRDWATVFDDAWAKLTSLMADRPQPY